MSDHDNKPQQGGAWMDRMVSGFKTVKTNTPAGALSLREFFDYIRGERWKAHAEASRTAYRTEGKAAYHAHRAENVPAFTLSGTFPKRCKEGLDQHSRVLCLDFDGLGERLEEVRASLVEDDHVLAVFRSLGGDGLKAICPTDANDQASHEKAYAAALAHFKALGPGTDTSCRDVCRLCYVSHDPDLFLRPSSFLPSLFSGTNPIPDTAPVPNTETVPTTTIQTAVDNGVGGAIVGRLDRLEALRKRDPVTCDLYETIVAPNFTPAPHCRNEALTELIPFLYRAVSGEKIGALGMAILEVNRDVFTGLEADHMKSIQGLWEGCEKAYPGELTAGELAVYQRLQDHQRAVFRICRDLARRGNPAGEFFMAGDHLGRRVAPRCNGWRELKRLSSLGVILPIKKGRRREAGVRGEAGRYRWLLAKLAPLADAQEGAS